MIPDEKVSVNTFSIIGDKLQEQLRALISEKSEADESKPFTLAKNLYRACMNKTLIEERGLAPVYEKLDSLGGWPVLKGDRWDEKSTWSWQQAVKDFRKVGYSMDYVFDFSVGVDLKKSLSRTIDVSGFCLFSSQIFFFNFFLFVVQIDQSALGLSREYLIKGISDKIVKAYYEYMVDIAVIYGAPRESAQRELMESLEFEMALANVSLPPY